MNPVVWQPTATDLAHSNIHAFRQYLQERLGVSLADSDALYEWSVAQSPLFWDALWQFSGVRAVQQSHQILQQADKMPGAKWFTGARLNYAENLLGDKSHREAIVFRSENGQTRSYTRQSLYDAVSRCASAMRNAGVEAGDRVAGFVPNIPETVVVMLAAASIGAVWSSCSPDFGIQGVLDRFGQIEPKLLFCTDGYHYNGKFNSSLDKINCILGQLPSVKQLVVIPYGDEVVGDIPEKAITYSTFVAPYPAGEILFNHLAFDHPLFIMYSSGTTGVPKCIVHSVGGTLLQHLKEHLLHGNLKPEDRLFYFTTCGWMMWNWLVGALATGATIILFDGSPFYPGPSVLWKLAEETGATHFGTSAKYLSALEKAHYQPAQHYPLSALRTVYSTGSPLLPESYDFVYQYIKPEVRLCSISGGTDIISCFVLGNPDKPIRRGEIQQRGFGMAVKVYNEQGVSVVGEKGELVCTQPFPSMPIGFWNDADGSKYRKAYFERFNNIWCHGDYAELTPEGGMVIYGRSDTVLNPGGVRIGTAEIYRQVERFPEVAESMAVGQDWDGDVRVVLFVRMQPGKQLDEALRQAIRKQIREGASPRHVPAKILAVADIPRTISGKIVELAVRNVIHGQPVKNQDALANPEALKLFENLQELQFD